jgi:hypothetical protein
MATYKTRDGITISGETPAQVIEALRAASWGQCRTLREYMQATARAAQLQTGHEVDGDTASELLAGLIAAGLISQEIE